MNVRSLLPIGRDRKVARRDSNPFISLQREVDRMFDEFAQAFPSFGFPATGAAGLPDLTPRMDISETDKEFEITAELPGLEEKDCR